MTIAPPEIRAAKATLAAHRKAVRKARPAKVQPVAAEQRKPRQRDPGYLQFVRRQACAAGSLGDCDGPIEAAHVRYSSVAAGRKNPGLSQKPDDRCAVPLCASHHRTGPHAQHSMSEAKFWTMVGVDPVTLYRQLGEQYDGSIVRRGER